MKVHKFPRGGISFEDRTAPKAGKSVLSYLPQIALIPLKQHSGISAAPVIGVGGIVREGETAARSTGAGGADIHSSVPGEVVGTGSWHLSETQKNDALIIKVKGSFELLGKKTQAVKWQTLQPFELRRIISSAGIVDAQEGGRPLSDTLVEKAKENLKRTLVVRYIFDDPWLAADLTLCKERADAVAEGACILAAASGADEIITAVSKNVYETGKSLRDSINDFSGSFPVSLALVSSRYPQRGKREIELALRKFENKLMAHFGSFIIAGPAELAAVYDAVVLQKPFITRYVAAGGSAVRKPSILNVRIGTRLGDVFEQCGGFKKKPGRIGFGSALFGREAQSLDEPVDKTTFAVYAEAKSVFSFWKKTSFAKPASCINCGLCRAVCPVGLDPAGLYKERVIGNMDAPYSYLNAQCHGCACCQAVCPSRLPLCTVLKGYGGAN